MRRNARGFYQDRLPSFPSYSANVIADVLREELGMAGRLTADPSGMVDGVLIAMPLNARLWFFNEEMTDDRGVATSDGRTIATADLAGDGWGTQWDIRTLLEAEKRPLLPSEKVSPGEWVRYAVKEALMDLAGLI